MGTPHRDDPTSAPASAPGEATSPSALPKARHLKIVPLDPDRRSAPPPSEPDWAALMRRVAEQHDREAFGQLFSHFAPRLKSYLMRTGSSDAAAEELAQDTLVTVWRKAAMFKAVCHSMKP